jgi:hypothetical protein
MIVRGVVLVDYERPTNHEIQGHVNGARRATAEPFYIALGHGTAVDDVKMCYK